MVNPELESRFSGRSRPFALLGRLAACCLVAARLTSFPVPAVAAAEKPTASELVRVNLLPGEDPGPPSLLGRVLLTAADGGILFEERNGVLHNLKPDEFDGIADSGESFRPLNADELASDLLAQMGDTFAIHQTQKFVFCYQCSPLFVRHCGELLEVVFRQYFEFFGSSAQPVVREPEFPLPIIIFRSTELLEEHARRQHPDISFEDVPGYYSVRYNQVLLSGLAPETTSRGDLIRALRKVPRHTETIVHEVVHQLGYNSGLHVRFADNPLWFTEGLAVYFETSSGRGRLLWDRPGRPSAMYLPGLRRQSVGAGLPLSLKDLLQGNTAFQEATTVADAYAESWALVSHLIREDRPLFDRLAGQMQQRSPLQEVPPAAEIELMESLLERGLSDLEGEVLQTIRRLRASR